MNKPKSFYTVADEFGGWFGEKPIERVDTIDVVPHLFTDDFMRQLKDEMRALGVEMPE